MAFLPLYMPGSKRLKIVIAGGGYAGIAAMTTLYRYMPGAEITLIDPNTDHLKITHLHETFRYPLTDFLVPFSELTQHFGCHHVRSSLSITAAQLKQWQQAKCIQVDEHALPFDYLLITTGVNTNRNDSGAQILGLDDFTRTAGSDLLTQYLPVSRDTEAFITIVGGGATGIQFLFEITDFLRRMRSPCKLRLVDSGEHILRQFPTGFSRYVQTRMLEESIEFHSSTRFSGQKGNQLLLEHKATGQCSALPSIVSLVFSGKQEETLKTNAFGQVVIDQVTLTSIFAAGDCAHYQSFGSNAMTAQSAVRKGKLAARNLLRHSGIIKVMEPYLHRDIGYIVSLGAADAVGWLAIENNVVTGIPALLVKEVVEAQYDLLLTGVDTYLI
ncbi:MAG: FAD-dependent oxidoreductase [Nitrosomonas sp.]|nr:FAD-dependent oxidoreductase [Nitrosomonas sp.]